MGERGYNAPNMSTWEVADKLWPWMLRLLGVSIVLWQLLVDQVDRPYLLLLAGGMLGLEQVVKIQNALKK